MLPCLPLPTPLGLGPWRRALPSPLWGGELLGTWQFLKGPLPPPQAPWGGLGAWLSSPGRTFLTFPGPLWQNPEEG